jgi:hypothetical protein
MAAHHELSLVVHEGCLLLLQLLRSYLRVSLTLLRHYLSRSPLVLAELLEVRQL